MGDRETNQRWTWVDYSLLMLGFLVVLLGALVGKLWTSTLTAFFYKEMALTESSKGYSEWMSPSVDIITKIYLWNWTNAESFEAAGNVPHFDEVGPYVFREKHQKINVTWNDNGTVTFRVLKRWFFDPGLSVGTLDDQITSVNTVAASMSALSLDRSYMEKKSLGLSLIAMDQKAFWTKSAGQLTFEGFENPILKLSSYVSANSKNKFGYFYGMNGTIPGDLNNVATGVLDILRIGQVEFVNHKNKTPAHEGACSDMTGSLGEFWAPNSNNATKLTMYTPDMCRRISYYYDREVVRNGIRSFMFSSTPATVDNGSSVEENACYCHPGDCQPSGVFDLRSCREGAPVFMSLPHLLHADPYHRRGVEGLKPDPEKHKFYITIEPLTGVTLEVAARLQLNVRISRNPGVRQFRNAPEVLVPVFWIETLASLPVAYTSGLSVFLLLLRGAPFACAATVLVGALLIVVVTARKLMWKRCQFRKRKASINAERAVMEVLIPEATNDGKCQVK